MITKLLLTLGVIAIAWLVLRNRSRRGQVAAGERAAQLAAPAERRRDGAPRLAAYTLVVFMILGSGLFLYFQWRDEYRIVTVEVINTQTGHSVSYQARRGDVDARSFLTLDGRQVNVAETERIEMGGLRRE